jgi:hypothetical protein
MLLPTRPIQAIGFGFFWPFCFVWLLSSASRQKSKKTLAAAPSFSLQSLPRVVEIY